jgi:hypothetical protein
MQPETAVVSAENRDAGNSRYIFFPSTAYIVL